MTFCTQCGKPLPDNAEFCSACGSPVHETAVTGEPDETSPDSSVPTATDEEQPTPPDPPPAAATDSNSNNRALLFAGIALIAVVVVVGAWFAWQSFGADSDDENVALPSTTTSVEQVSTTAATTSPSTTTVTTTTLPPTTTTTLPPTTTTTLPGDLVAGLTGTGVFVGDGSTADPAALQAAVDDAHRHGWDLSVAALATIPGSDASAYAGSIATATNAGTVVVVTPDALGWATQEAQFLPGEFERAWNLIPPGSDEAGAVRAFVRSVLGGPDSIGAVNTADARWGLLLSDDSIASLTFGEDGDMPFVGDWDCDGIDTPGVYRSDTQEVFLRNSNSDGPADISYDYRVDGAEPIAGDFDGDGCDTVSFYFPGNGFVRIFNTPEIVVYESETGTPFDTSYIFGDTGDIAFVGDFDGDGADTIGLYRPSTGTVFLKNSHVEGPADVEFSFGDAGDLPIAGDWGPEDGVDTVALYRPDTGVFYFRFTNSAGPPDATLEAGAPGGLPVAGAFGLNRSG